MPLPGVGGALQSLRNTAAKAIQVAYNAYKARMIGFTTTVHDWKLRGKVKSAKLEFRNMSAIQARNSPDPLPQGDIVQDVTMYIRGVRGVLIRRAEKQLAGKTGSLKLIGKALMRNKNDGELVELHFGKSYLDVNPNRESIARFIDNSTGDIQTKIDEFTKKGSGWVFIHLTALHLNFIANDRRTDVASGSIDIPKCLSDTKGVINVNTTDHKCFMYAVLSSYLGKTVKGDHRYRPAFWDPYINTFNWEGIDFPADIEDCQNLEQLNPGVSPCHVGRGPSWEP